MFDARSPTLSAERAPQCGARPRDSPRIRSKPTRRRSRAASSSIAAPAGSLEHRAARGRPGATRARDGSRRAGGAEPTLRSSGRRSPRASMPHRDHRADERARARAADAVDRDPRGEQLLDHADVGEAPGPAAGEHDPHRAAREAPGHALDDSPASRSFSISPRAARAARARSRPSVPAPAPGRAQSREEEIAASKISASLGPLREPRRPRAHQAPGPPGARRSRPHTSSPRGPPSQHDVVELGLVALEQV